MDLATTFRGLNRMEAGTATRALERSSSRFHRLLDGPTKIKAVIERESPEYRVIMSMGLRGQDLTSEERGHNLGNVIASACERLRVQLVRTRHRAESQRHRAVVGAS